MPVCVCQPVSVIYCLLTSNSVCEDSVHPVPGLCPRAPGSTTPWPCSQRSFQLLDNGLDWLIDWLSQGFTSTRHRVNFGDVPQANLLAGMEKLNLLQQKHKFTNQKKCTTTQNKCPAHVVQWSNHLGAMCSRAWRSQWPRIDSSLGPCASAY